MNKQAIQAQNLIADAQEYIAKKTEEEQGDTFSYLVFVVGMIAAAIAVRGKLVEVLEAVVDKVGADSLA